jgi:hypothetical protein
MTRFAGVHNYVLNRCKTGAKHNGNLFGTWGIDSISLLSNRAVEV